MKKIGVGVIGCGFIAQSAHLPNYQNNARVRLVAVADTDAAKLNTVEEKFIVEETFTDYHCLLDRKDIDAVSVCVPTNLHAQTAIEAMDAGKHVLCEKPMALTLDQADDMIRASQRNDVKLMVGHNFRFLPNHQLALRYLRENRIGRPFLVKAHLATSSAPAGPYIDVPEGSFYLDPSRGGGVLFDTGCHVLDLLLWMFGEVKSVSANLGTYTEGVNVDDVATLVIQFESGLLAVVDLCWVNLPDYFVMKDDNLIEILGSEGKIESDLFGPSMSFYSKNSFMCKLRGKLNLIPRQIDPKNPLAALEHSYREEISEFVRSIVSGAQPAISGEDAKKTLKLVLDARTSFKMRKILLLSES